MFTTCPTRMCEQVVKRYSFFFKPDSVLFFLSLTDDGITKAAKKVNISQTRGRTYIQKFIDGGLVEKEYRGVYRLTEDGEKLREFFGSVGIDVDGGLKIE